MENIWLLLREVKRGFPIGRRCQLLPPYSNWESTPGTLVVTGHGIARRAYYDKKNITVFVEYTSGELAGRIDHRLIG